MGDFGYTKTGSFESSIADIDTCTVRGMSRSKAAAQNLSSSSDGYRCPAGKLPIATVGSPNRLQWVSSATVASTSDTGRMPTPNNRLGSSAHTSFASHSL